MILGVCGLIGSGKGAVSDYLQEKYNFQHMSFADSLKEAVSAVFGWPFELLQGKTSESRAWREIVDPWWAERLNIPDLTPRKILQQWGTEVCRQNFHQDIWLASLEQKISKTSNNIVIDDCRFPNEINAIRKQHGILIQVVRGKEPNWYSAAMHDLTVPEGPRLMDTMYPDVHVSEWGWVNQKFDIVIDNIGTMEELYQKVDGVVQNLVV